MRTTSMYVSEAAMLLHKRSFALWRFIIVSGLLLLFLHGTSSATGGNPCVENRGDLRYVKLNGTSYNGAIGNILNGVQQGDKVKICFKTPAGAGTYTLVSYKAPGPVFDINTVSQQVLFDYQTVYSTGNERICLEIEIPDCYFQVELVYGCVIEQLSPTNLYGDRIISTKLGGTRPCLPLEGCTPGYWKQEHHFGNWGCGYDRDDKFFEVFNIYVADGSTYKGLPSSLTLLQALSPEMKIAKGEWGALARHAVAALLNACTDRDINYEYSTRTIKRMVKRAFASNNSSVKDRLANANEQNCPLGRAELNGVSQTSNLLKALEGNQLTAYPTPFSDKATIAFKLAKDEAYSISLYDTKGSIVRQLKAGVAKAGELNQVEVDGAGLPEGLYIARMVSDSGGKTVKLLLKKE
ncbi:T9SS type A sorting domain-containing protein [Pontibacter sp. CAU 1760]